MNVIQPNIFANQGVVPNSGNEAILFLFSPRQMTDHFKRPLAYKFDGPFIERVSDVLVHNPTQNSIRSIVNDPSTFNTIIPSADGFLLNTSLYSSLWTFVFIVDETDTSSAFKKLSNRVIYFGVCSEEPISNVHSATPEKFINGRCSLSITRKVIVNRHHSLGTQGYRTDDKTLIDNNIIDYQEPVWQSPTNGGMRDYFCLTPEHLMNNTVVDNGGSINVLDYGDSINVKKTASVFANHESPRNHLTSLLTSMNVGVENTMYNDRMGEFGVSGGTTSYNDLSEDFLTNARDSICGQSSVESNLLNRYNQTGMNENQYIDLAFIMQKYYPKVIPIQTRNDALDIIPQHYTSISNVFSSLICACIPAYLNSVGLSAISFSFNSYNSDTQVHHIESLTDNISEQLRMKWNAFLLIFKSDLFPILINNGGHFDLNIFSSINGSTNVTLNFLDNTPLPLGAVYQENTILGGILSPLIGSTENLSNNANQLNNLVHNIGMMMSS